MLEEFLQRFNLAPHSLAIAIHVPASRIADIVNAWRRISPDAALSFGRFFRAIAQFWLNLQNNYELSVVEAEKKGTIKKIIPLKLKAAQGKTNKTKKPLAGLLPSLRPGFLKYHLE